jgi:hypothetical protein
MEEKLQQLLGRYKQQLSESEQRLRALNEDIKRINELRYELTGAIVALTTLKKEINADPKIQNLEDDETVTKRKHVNNK